MTVLNKQKVGLFGGTFDPVHDGHVAVARHVLAYCDIQYILFIPAPHPPHKKITSASFTQRVDMLNLALQGEQQMRVSLIENEYPGLSYTVRTIKELKQRRHDVEYYLIIGADSLVDLPQWYKAKELIALVHLIVAGRDKVAMPAVEKTITSFHIPYTSCATGNKWVLKNGNTIQYLSDLEWPVSSSELRRQLAQGKRPTMMSPAVYRYIVENKLYLHTGSS
ncbi:nicotinate (nicotinamide) nucleotide adenylyltransferase [Desulfogranum marinum]|uniref:nicotinate (nicotinamide) nucleotide adenylyltransferase n=1 Tax=Desulfogranum marinum TaxID=453220 RepID=UPI0029C8765F|nr:nicotinate (nicotinamide) nucleotide adenylyltransferase [Desulfogranum marinum]